MNHGLYNFIYPIIDITNQDGDLCNASKFTETLIEEGISIIQLRAKSVDDRTFLMVALKVSSIIRNYKQENTRTKLIINDRVDICLLAKADGVHLGQNDIPPNKARHILGPSSIIGLSTHNMSQVKLANKEPIDYIGFGPVFNSITKNHHAPVTGLEELREVINVSSHPVIPIGGITINNVEMVYKTKAKSVAVVSDLKKAINLSHQISKYLSIYKNYGEPFKGFKAASS
jgi:thiamine-phosphate pyrophosphorylase